MKKLTLGTQGLPLWVTLRDCFLMVMVMMMMTMMMTMKIMMMMIMMMKTSSTAR